MIYLLIAILSMSGFMLGLKFLNTKKIDIPQAVMTNYALAIVIAIVSGWNNLSWETVSGVFATDWWYRGIVAGLLYFASMDLMAVSTRLAGVAVTTISARSSLILPILWSFFFFGEYVSPWQWTGICLVIAAFVMIFYQRRTASVVGGGSGSVTAVLMPLGVFAILGIIAVCMKSSQHAIRESGNYATDYPLFEILIFGSALVGAVIYYAVKQGRRAFRFGWKSVAGGLFLGACNYLVTIGIMHGLRFVSTGTFYAVYNVSVVVITTLAGVLAFREKLGPRKIAGICLAIAAIAILSILG